jgi:hypothetical protein
VDAIGVEAGSAHPISTAACPQSLWSSHRFALHEMVKRMKKSDSEDGVETRDSEENAKLRAPSGAVKMSISAHEIKDWRCRTQKRL